MRKYQFSKFVHLKATSAKQIVISTHFLTSLNKVPSSWIAGLVGGLVMIALCLPAVAQAQAPSPLDPASAEAQGIADLYWLSFWIALVVFVVVEGLLLYAVIRFRQTDPDVIPPKIHGSTPLEIAWTVAPALVLVILFVLMLRTMTATAQPPDDALLIRVTGHQWWWEFEYPELGIVTANELHIPAGEPVVVELHSDNVIHSFWIPRLAGKTDVIPGQTNTMWFEADQAGTYRGQCAELCGAQHANMNFLVMADLPGAFEAWVSQQQSPAVEPVTELQQAGQETFLTGQCIACHAIQGTTAQGIIGPDLTHFGSRETIAGLVLDNHPENLARWLEDNQKIKPLNKMVINELSQADIEALVEYLSSLE